MVINMILNEFSPPPLHLCHCSLLVVVITEEGEMPLGTLVGEVSSVPTLEAGDLV